VADGGPEPKASWRHEREDRATCHAHLRLHGRRALYIYLLSADNDLLRFDPASITLKTIGKVACPTFYSPNSMAIHHRGVAYAGFTDRTVIGVQRWDGQIFTISTSTAECSATSYVAQRGFALSVDQCSKVELFLASNDCNNGVVPAGLDYAAQVKNRGQPPSVTILPNVGHSMQANPAGAAAIEAAMVASCK
jgi:hypothetical protein